MTAARTPAQGCAASSPIWQPSTRSEGPVALLAVLLQADLPKETLNMALVIFALDANPAGIAIGWYFTKRDEERTAK